MDRDSSIKKILIKKEIEKRNCEKSYYFFAKKAFEVLEPETKLIDNWHIKYLCDILQNEIERIARGEPKDKDININICPRSFKSYIVSILLCPWAWIKYPHLKFINSSHSRDLSIEHCVEGRRLITSDWYQEHWSDVYSLSTDQNVKSHYKNNRGGKRFACSVASGVTGHGANIIVVDDLMDPRSAHSDAERKTAIDHYFKTLYSRINDQEVDLRVNIQQRLHEEDVSGIILDKYLGKYRHICIPAKADVEIIRPKELIKNYTNNLFFEARFSEKMLNDAERSLGSADYHSQYSQRPSPPGGHIIQRNWFNFYRKLPNIIDGWYTSVDCSFAGKKKNGNKENNPDYVVIQLWVKSAANYYLVDQVRGQFGFLKTRDEIIRTKLNYPKISTIWVEKKANGDAIIDSLQDEISGIVPFVPDKYGDKEARLHAVSGVVQAGNVYLPLTDEKSWVENFIYEITMFPNAKNDDQVDAFTQFLLNMNESGVERLKKFLIM